MNRPVRKRRNLCDRWLKDAESAKTTLVWATCVGVLALFLASVVFDHLFMQ